MALIALIFEPLQSHPLFGLVENPMHLGQRVGVGAFVQTFEDSTDERLVTSPAHDVGEPIENGPVAIVKVTTPETFPMLS